jgi:hypothetical protein
MRTIDLKVNLPDQLVKDVVCMGLASPDSLQTLLREAVRNHRLTGLAEARKRVAAANILPLSKDKSKLKLPLIVLKEAAQLPL